MDERQAEVSKRITELIPWWDMDGRTTEEAETEIYNTISVDPVTTINFLLDIIDDLKA